MLFFVLLCITFSYKYPLLLLLHLILFIKLLITLLCIDGKRLCKNRSDHVDFFSMNMLTFYPIFVLNECICFLI